MSFRAHKKSGFTLAEILVSLVFVTLGIILVGALAQQVARLAQSSKQVGAVVEWRNKSNAITRDTNAWLQKLRSQVSLNGVGIFSGCIPDNFSGISTYACPATNPSILTNDSELNEIAKGLHVIDTPLVDVMGNPIAGTLAAPLYLDIEGRLCEEANASTTCALKSTGYFLRKNAATNANPQEISFVIKIEKNSLQANPSNSTPMKAQYMVIEIGKQWVKPVDASQTCTEGTVKVGYLADGNPQCLSATQKCSSDKVQLGIDDAGNAICAVKPTTCLPTEFVVYDGNSKSLTCSASTPCTSGTFVGYYSGTGQAMCYQGNPPCGNGSIQVGQSENGPAQCVSITTCASDKPFLTFNGTAFVCSAAPDGSRGVAGENGLQGTQGEEGLDGQSAFIFEKCPERHYVAGINGSRLICEPLDPRAPASPTPTYMWYTSNIAPSSAALPRNRGVAGSCESTCQAKGKVATGRCHSGENTPLAGESFPPNGTDFASTGLWDGITYRFKGPYGQGIGKTFFDVWCYKANNQGVRTQKDDRDWSDVIEACECKDG